MTNTQELKQILNHIQDIYFASTLLSIEDLQNSLDKLSDQQNNGIKLWFLKDKPSTPNIRVKRYRTGHWVLYNEQGLRILLLDPNGRILHECEWNDESHSPPKLSR